VTLHIHTTLAHAHIHDANEELQDRLARRYAAFVDAPGTNPTTHGPVLQLTLAGEPRVLEGNAALHGAVDGDTLTILAAGQPWAALNRSTGKASVVPHRSLAAVDVLLRCELTLRALSQGGLALHAASVLLGNGVHVFAGVSGAGKSTVAAQLAAQGATVLSDEFTVLTPGPDGRFVAHGTPFWSGVPQTAAVAGIWRLGRGDAAVDHLRAPQVLAHLAKNLALMLAGGQWIHQSLQAAAALARVTPGHELRYRLGQPIVSLVEAAP
jgi:hypothetical protein